MILCDRLLRPMPHFWLKMLSPHTTGMSQQWEERLGRRAGSEGCEDGDGGDGDGGDGEWGKLGSTGFHS